MQGIPFSHPDEGDADQFIERAKAMLVAHYNSDQDVMLNYLEPLRASQVYVVWFSKTLQNWKALLSTSVPDGKYYELTYNGDQHEAYLDVYLKMANVVIPG